MLTRVPLEEDLAHRFKDNVLWEVILRDTDKWCEAGKGRKLIQDVLVNRLPVGN